MFVTNNAYKSRVPDYLSGADETYWSAAGLSQNLPWFVVKIYIADPLDETGCLGTQRTMLMSNIEEVESLSLLADGKSMAIDSVFIVTPSYLNGTDNWKMDRLAALWVGQEPLVPTQTAKVFETAEGRCFSLSSLNTEPEKLLNKALRLSF